MSEGAVQETGGATGPTAGMLLRQAREAAGMHIAALAVSLKVPVNKLEALEADNFTALPDAVFVRALASSVCRTLKVDPSAVLERLPQSQPPRLAAASAGINAAFKDPHAKAAAPLGASPGSRNAVLAVLVLLVGAALVYFLPHGTLESLRSQAASTADTAATAAQVPVAPAEPVLAAEPAQAAQAPAPAPTPAASAVAAPAAPVTVVNVPAQAPAVQASTTVAGEAAASSGIVEFRASGDSWVQVRDASGTVTFQRSLKAGEAASASGKPPLSVVVGRVNATEVFVRGAPFDLATVARENVARFEVK